MPKPGQDDLLESLVMRTSQEARGEIAEWYEVIVLVFRSFDARLG